MGVIRSTPVLLGDNMNTCGSCIFFDGVYCIEGKFNLHRNKTDQGCNYYKKEK